MAESLLTVRTEVLAGGFNRLGASVINRLINDAYIWVATLHLWPFREAAAAGAAPLTIADIGVVASVKDTANGNNRLKWTDRRTIEEMYGDLTVAGTPNWWYFEGTVIKTFPVGGTLSVRYWKTPVPLVADGDALIVPDRWVQVVIDKTRQRACLRQQDWAGANALRGEVLAGVDEMRMAELANQAADPDTVIVYGGEGF